MLKDHGLQEFLLFLHESSEEYFFQYADLYKNEIGGIMADFFPFHIVHPDDKMMVFIDGENLAIRYPELFINFDYLWHSYTTSREERREEEEPKTTTTTCRADSYEHLYRN